MHAMLITTSLQVPKTNVNYVQTLSPNECKTRVSRAIILEGVDDLCLGLSNLSLNGEYSGEDEYAAYQADQIVKEWSDSTQLDGSLGPLHEGGVSQKYSQSSICCNDIVMYMEFRDTINSAPVSQAFCEIASSHNLADFMLAVGKENILLDEQLHAYSNDHV